MQTHNARAGQPVLHEEAPATSADSKPAPDPRGGRGGRAAAHAMHLKTAPDRVDQRLQRRRVCCLVRRVADASAPATGRLTLSKTVIGRSSPRLRRTCPACSAACPGFRSKSGPSSRSARNRPQPANTTPRADGTILEPGPARSVPAVTTMPAVAETTSTSPSAPPISSPLW